jgi:hypothetical protein
VSESRTKEGEKGTHLGKLRVATDDVDGAGVARGAGTRDALGDVVGNTILGILGADSAKETESQRRKRMEEERKRTNWIVCLPLPSGLMTKASGRGFMVPRVFWRMKAG